MLRRKTLHNWAGASVKTRIGCLFQIKYTFRGLITLDSHAPNKLHEPIDVLVADSYNLDNNEIGIGEDCAATLGVVREIFSQCWCNCTIWNKLVGWGVLNVAGTSQNESFARWLSSQKWAACSAHTAPFWPRKRETSAAKSQAMPNRSFNFLDFCPVNVRCVSSEVTLLNLECGETPTRDAIFSWLL